MLNLSEYSPESLEKIQKILKIVLDELEIQGINRLAGNKIPLEKFEKEGSNRDDVLAVFNRINENKNLIRLVEESFDSTNLEFYPPKTELEKMEFSAQKQAESERYISFIVINSEKLKKIKEDVDKKLRKIAKVYAKEIQNKRLNIYDLGYDRNLNLKEVVKENERVFQQQTKEERDERERRERLRIQRITTSGKPPILYTIDKIIEECLTNKSEERIEIDFYSLGFEDNIHELNNASRFFNKLKSGGCFDNVERSANTWFVVTKPDIEKLKICRKKLIGEFYESSSKMDEKHFNYKNGSLTFNTEIYKPREEARKIFIKNLWIKHQKQNDKGKIIDKEGERLPESFYAIKIGIIHEVEEFRNQKIKDKFKRMKKELNRIFKNKGFPIKIDSAPEGILLIQTI